MKPFNGSESLLPLASDGATLYGLDNAMRILVVRTPPLDAPYWHGRRLFATLDAVAWPSALILALMQLPGRGGIVGGLFIAVALIAAARRLRRALWRNHRYRFTTRRWGSVLLILCLIGWVLKWTLTL